MEEKLQNLFQELENEQSLKSDHEMRIIEEMLVFFKYIHLIFIVPRFKKNLLKMAIQIVHQSRKANHQTQQHLD